MQGVSFNMKNLWNNKQQESTFCSEAKHPASWVIRSRFLKESADKVAFTESSNSHLAWINFMLLGMALESLIKGHMVFRGIQVIESKRGSTYIKKVYRNHNIHKLAKKIECPALPITEKEYKILEKLSHFIKWAGRYPVPTNHLEIGPLQASSEELEEINKLYNHLLTPLLGKQNE